jgi:hypothetical protein
MKILLTILRQNWRLSKRCLHFKTKLIEATNSFRVINEYQQAKIKRDKLKLPANIDLTDEIESEFVKSLAELLTIKAFLFRHGYTNTWDKLDIEKLYQSYTLLRIKDYE